MFCPFARRPDGGFRGCCSVDCMAYDNQEKSCKLIEKARIKNKIINNYPYTPFGGTTDGEI